MDKTKFLNQKVKDMDAMELLSAVKYKLKHPKPKGLPKVGDSTELLTLGDIVRVVKDYESGKNPQSLVGKEVELLNTSKMGSLHYRIRTNNGYETWVHKVELVAKKVTEKKSLSDKIFDNPDGDEMLLLGDVQETIKKFVHWINENMEYINIADDELTQTEKAKELFGDRIMGVKK